MLTIPLMTFHGKRVGVMQLINAKNHDNHIVPFSKESQALVPLFANNAAVAVDRGVMNREMILRMVRMAELRDPTETGTHVQRVGAYAAELYQRWAIKQGHDTQEMKRKKDLIRLAAMLHDVGKVAISDLILKKPGRFTPEEFETMKKHTLLGARLFSDRKSDFDDAAAEVALNHHERWDGRGYPGYVDVATGNPLSDHVKADATPMGKAAEEIPLYGRIVALADVFDALSSARVYKEAWDEAKVLETIEKESGNQFDPELVEIFFAILDVLRSIQNRFQDTH
jgi:response regulator RpfG family c-di-GMP phosphodiesterase